MELKLKHYKFKNAKHSVIMILLMCDANGNCLLENRDYKGLTYKAHLDELEEVEL